MNADRKDRNDATEANEAMNRKFGKDRGASHQTAEDLKRQAAQEANEAARVRRPLP
jgi:hypothetical protein